MKDKYLKMSVAFYVVGFSILLLLNWRLCAGVMAVIAGTLSYIMHKIELILALLELLWDKGED